MDSKRVIITLAVFAGIYFAAPYIIGWTNYDMYMQAIEFLAAVTGAGCYWIGSNKH